MRRRRPRSRRTPIVGSSASEADGRRSRDPNACETSRCRRQRGAVARSAGRGHASEVAEAARAPVSRTRRGEGRRSKGSQTNDRSDGRRGQSPGDHRRLRRYTEAAAMRRADCQPVSRSSAPNRGLLPRAPFVRQSASETADCSLDAGPSRAESRGAPHGGRGAQQMSETGLVSASAPIFGPPSDRLSMRLCERSGVGVEPTHRWVTPAWPILKTGWATGPCRSARQRSAAADALRCALARRASTRAHRSHCRPRWRDARRPAAPLAGGSPPLALRPLVVPHRGTRGGDPPRRDRAPAGTRRAELGADQPARRITWRRSPASCCSSRPLGASAVDRQVAGPSLLEVRREIVVGGVDEVADVPGLALVASRG